MDSSYHERYRKGVMIDLSTVKISMMHEDEFNGIERLVRSNSTWLRVWIDNDIVLNILHTGDNLRLFNCTERRDFEREESNDRFE